MSPRNPILALLVAVIRFLWPLYNARTREIVGTVLGLLAAAVYVLSEVLASAPPDPAPDVPVPAMDVPVPSPDALDAPEEGVNALSDPGVADPLPIESVPVAVLRHAVGLVLPVGCSGPQRTAWRAFGEDVAACLGARCGLVESVVLGLQEGNWGAVLADRLPCLMGCLGSAVAGQIVIRQGTETQRAAWYGTSDEVRRLPVYEVRIERPAGD